MSFRSRVLDALDIKKTTIKLQVNETFPKIYKDDVPLVGDTPNELQGETVAQTISNQVPYVVSKTIFDTPIGPNPIGGGAIKQSLDVLGFVVGKDVYESNMDGYDASTNPTPGVSYKNMYPITTPPLIGTSTAVKSNDASGLTRVGHAGGHDALYTGFHCLNGLYDSESKELQHMRKSALPVSDMDTMGGTTAALASTAEHSHKDWPDNIMDQHHLLNENPYADSLYYHSMKLSLLLTGITIPDVSEKASNHRGVLRMLILRPRIPSIKMRWDGVSNQPHINMAHPPHWDTDLFYTKKRTMGGRMDKVTRTNTANIAANATATPAIVGTFDADKSHMIPTFGLMRHANTMPNIDNDVKSLHYGHRVPGNGIDHDFTSYDVLTAPINRDKYAVVVDRMVALDTVHHGVASKRLENIIIPFNKKIKFPGRKGDSNLLTSETIDEPVNMASRPIIMFLSMDQKISCQVTGYTTISEC